MSEYKPYYAKGEIVVCFKEGFGPSIGTDIAKVAGYKMERPWDYGERIVIYKIPEGEEDKAIKNLENKYSEFIEWAEKRDLKLESRWNSLEKILEKLTNLRDSSDELGNKEYSCKLREIEKEIKEHRKDVKNYKTKIRNMNE